MQSIDAGLRATVFNAAGGVIEQRMGKAPSFSMGMMT